MTLVEELNYILMRLRSDLSGSEMSIIRLQSKHLRDALQKSSDGPKVKELEAIIAEKQSQIDALELELSETAAKRKPKPKEA